MGTARYGKLYSKRQIRHILQEQDANISQICTAVGVPKACLQAVVCKELLEIDYLDVVADDMVRLHWAERALRLRVQGAEPSRYLLRKRDSSTGCGQIFAYVAIHAIQYARAHQIPAVSPAMRALATPDGQNPSDLRTVWYLLYRDPVFNLECSALNLLVCAEEMTGRADFSDPSQLPAIFTRYNANTRTVTAYGREVYGYYLRFQARAEK